MKATKKTETKVTGITLELTIEEAIRLKIIMGELEDNGHGTVENSALLENGVDRQPAFGYALYHWLARELP